MEEDKNTINACNLKSYLTVSFLNFAPVARKRESHSKCAKIGDSPFKCVFYQRCGVYSYHYISAKENLVGLHYWL
jgi:hypothetical protein